MDDDSSQTVASTERVADERLLIGRACGRHRAQAVALVHWRGARASKPWLNAMRWAPVSIAIGTALEGALRFLRIDPRTIHRL